MGRYVKNPPMIRNTRTAISTTLPVTDTYPSSTTTGQLLYDSNENSIAYFNGTHWVYGATVGRIQIAVDVYVGDGIETIYTMQNSCIGETDVLVFIGGIFQIPGPSEAYSVNGTTITFTEPIPLGDKAIVMFGYNQSA